MVLSLPSYPLLCLRTAEYTNTVEEFKGKNVVIDFWTTKCTRCPDALNKLNAMALDPKNGNVSFVSICCDKCDGAREIIEKDEELKWQNMSHYFMEHQDKEEAKKFFGFKAVPFYVFVNDKGEITQHGNSSAIDFGEIPGAVLGPVSTEEPDLVPEVDGEKISDKNIVSPEPKASPVAASGKGLEIDELDF